MNILSKFRKQRNQPLEEPGIEFWDHLHTRQINMEDLKSLLDLSVESSVLYQPDSPVLTYYRGSRNLANNVTEEITPETRRLHVHQKGRISAVSDGDYGITPRNVPEILVNENGISIFTYPKIDPTTNQPMHSHASMRDIVYRFANKKYNISFDDWTNIQILGVDKINYVLRDFGLESKGLLKEIPWDSEDIQTVLNFMNGYIGINELSYKLGLNWPISS